MVTFLICLVALLLDRWLGEPRRWHPLEQFGRWAETVEALCFSDDDQDEYEQRRRGMAAVALAVLPLVVLAWGLSSIKGLGLVFDIVILYLAIGAASLSQHARNVFEPLQQNNLEQARREVGKIVSRDTSELDETGVAKATVESVLENGNDAVFGALFWFVVAGAPGVILYRLINTLDAMWGYKTAQYLHFGWAAARLDDALNWIPARLTAFTYGLLGNREVAMECWREQGGGWKSPNAGPVMAAGAGALGIRLGGEASYQGNIEQRPILGKGDEPKAHDISRAIRLVEHGMIGWLAVILVLELLFA